MVLGNSKRPSSSDECCFPAYKHLRRSECVGMFSTLGSLVSGSESKSGTSSPHVVGPTMVNGCHFTGSSHEVEVSRGESPRSPRGTSSLYKGFNSTGASDVLRYRDVPGGSPQLVNGCPRTGDFIQQEAYSRFDAISDKDDETNSLANADEDFSVDPDEELQRSPSLTHENSLMGAYESAWGVPWLTYISDGKQDLVPDSFPGYFEDGHRICTGTASQVEDIRSPAYEYPYRKLVPVGSNHQADIPELKQPGKIWNSSVVCLSSTIFNETNDDDSHRWFGTCVTPMPDSNVLASEIRLGCRTECICEDKGSKRCSRQHVMEAREKLKRTLGEDVFKQLGFYDMGEDVAEIWTEEEEHMFEEIVLSNPASLGKNFWNYLPRYFPSRSCKELISYYFNVFMLRKRAQQNGLEPLHVDSDNDEWELSDNGECEEEEEGSVIESPVKDEIPCTVHHEDSDFGDACDDSTADEADREQHCDGPSVIKNEGKMLHDQDDEYDVQDDSCTSYEGQHHAGDSCGDSVDIQEIQYDLVEEHKSMKGVYRNDDLNGLHDADYDVGHCDMKPWDIGYHFGSTNSVDFLPTCNVIEEVFGKESWEDSMGGHGFS